MKAFVGVTDNIWFNFLSSIPEIDEVNFWQPSGTSVFRALNLGEQANQLRNSLQAPPTYLSEIDRISIDVALKACIGRLDGLEVEGLFVRFKELSKEAKASFLKRIQNMI